VTSTGDLEERWGRPVSRLRRGGWTCEIRGDEVADIRFDGVLLLRAVRAVVRDRDWNTVPVEVSAHRSDAEGTSLVADLRFTAPGISYDATLSLRLDEHDLAVDLDGRALADFERNRIGLVVLHPAVDAGREVEVQHSDGTTTSGRWPVDISPHQPFVDVTGFGWSTDGVTARLSLHGDVFESEDQRNWTDASFKTYSTPLSRPFPVVVPSGERCRQAVRLHASGRASRRQDELRPTVTVGTDVVGTLPSLSLGASLLPPPAQPVPSTSSYEAVLVELTGAEERWPALVQEAAAQAAAPSSGLDVRVVTADPDVVRRTLELLSDQRVLRFGAFHPDSHFSTEPLWTAARDEARRSGFAGQLVAGTRAHFTELNRLQAQIPPDAPSLTFSVTPQMHASEVPHLLDSLTVQRAVAENAVRIAGGRPLHVGPVTLARRFNAVASSGRPDPETEAEQATDPLQDTPFTAAWTLASVSALSVAGVATLTYYETAGPRGIRREDGTSTPAAEVLDNLAALHGLPLRSCTASTSVAALAVEDEPGVVRTWVANLRGAEQVVRVVDPDGLEHSLSLDGWAVEALTLRPGRHPGA
jgi:D-apionolactonase